MKKINYVEIIIILSIVLMAPLLIAGFNYTYPKGGQWVTLLNTTTSNTFGSSYAQTFLEAPTDKITWVVNVTGSPETFLANLEAGDPDDNWFMIDNCTGTLGNSIIMRHVVNKNTDRFRAYISWTNVVSNSPSAKISALVK